MTVLREKSKYIIKAPCKIRNATAEKVEQMFQRAFEPVLAFYVTLLKLGMKFELHTYLIDQDLFELLNNQTINSEISIGNSVRGTKSV